MIFAMLLFQQGFSIFLEAIILIINQAGIPTKFFNGLNSSPKISFKPLEGILTKSLMVA